MIEDTEVEHCVFTRVGIVGVGRHRIIGGTGKKHARVLAVRSQGAKAIEKETGVAAQGFDQVEVAEVLPGSVIGQAGGAGQTIGGAETQAISCIRGALSVKGSSGARLEPDRPSAGSASGSNGNVISLRSRNWLASSALWWAGGQSLGARPTRLWRIIAFLSYAIR